ncbi:tetratricopeptide repeat protein [Nocardia sp. CA-151230]|uniref:tetratricopeptide repeat protein n=1 Tax=Nocardia sp. CA-151230 TaxID=3239982 RepID=UPI003D8A7719
MYRSLRELVQLFGGSDLPTIGDLNPYQLGVTSSAFGNAHEHGHRDGYVPRTRNLVDARVSEALGSPQVVIVVGPSKAGKTRTVFEAIHTHHPTAKLLWPIADGIRELVAHPRVAATGDTIVVWLDDLHEYLTSSDKLTPNVLARLRERPGRTIVVATLRSEMRAQLRSDGELQRETRLLLEQAKTIDLASTSEDLCEQAAAGQIYPDQSFNGYGLGEVLAGAPELLQRYDDAAEIDPVQHAVIQVAIDWTRIGQPDAIPEQTLTELAMHRLRERRPDLDLISESVRAAISSAGTSPKGVGRAAALRTIFLDSKTRGYHPFDYLVAADDGQGDREPRPIPDAFWHMATRDGDYLVLTLVGISAQRRGDLSTAVSLLRQAVVTENALAMFALGSALTKRDEVEEGENWIRRAADKGNPSAILATASLFKDRGEFEEAERWCRRGVDTGDFRAMNNLAFLLVRRGAREEAETWYRNAADAGDLRAKHILGYMLKERGALKEAEPWYRAAADNGHPPAMQGLAILLADRGEVEEAETWYRRAAENGQIDAMHALSTLFMERGELQEAEAWSRRGAENGDLTAMYNLGFFLQERGELAESAIWCRKAADGGLPAAISILPALLEELGTVGGAEVSAQ